MTTPPKVRLFNIRRDSLPQLGARATGAPSAAARVESVRLTHGTPPAGGAGPEAQLSDDQLFAPSDEQDGLSDVNLVDDAPKATGDDDLAAGIEAVRAEGLNSRQLRIAGRLARHHQIEVGSDEEAVFRLRQRGIDPLHRNALNDLLSAEADKIGAAAPAAAAKGRDVAVLGKIDVAKRPAGALALGGPPTPPGGAQGSAAEESRAREILKIQRDIARRRKKRTFMMFLRLAAFVLLPTLLAGIYYYTIATPLYETKSEFIIQKADGSLAGSALGGMLAGAGLSGNVDSINVQSYLNSRDAMLRLDRDVGFSSYLMGENIDFLERLPEDATQDQAYGKYGKMVKISFDPSEGIIRMGVIAPDPLLSEQQALALIGYAEEQVDQLSARLRKDQVAEAQKSYDDAEAAVQAAKDQVLELQQQLGVLDPRAESGVVMSRISQLEAQIQQKELELGQLLANANPNQARVNGVRGDLTRLRAALEETRALLTNRGGADVSLAAMTAELELAQADLVTRQSLLATAATSVEAARIEANKQVRYLSISVNPVPPDEPTFPRAFENTLVSFLIFSGIYLMLSLTISILREQVSA